jgi:DNA-binding NarL/FixJ family response regulator
LKLRVFVVEDLHTVQKLLHDVLDARGVFEVVGTASTEAEANLWLEENPNGWDIIVADLILAQGSGISVVRRARLLTETGKVVVFSGYATGGVRDHLLRLGVDRVFDKANTDEFFAWLDEVVGSTPAG